MDKVICPYCPADKEHPDGVEMLYRERRTPGVGYGYAGRYECPICGSRAPEIRNVGIDAADLKAFAYAAAMRRHQPENRVLTLEELRNHEMPCGMWIEWRDEQRVLSEQTVGMCLLYQGDSESIPGYGTRWRAWLRRPTDEERASTPWTQNDA